MSSNFVESGSVPVTELKDDLMNLSKALHELYELMNVDMRNLGDAWRDGKYEEFVSGYKPKIQKCEEISQRYNKWCKMVLEPYIEDLKDEEGYYVGGEGGGVAGGAFGGSESSGNSGSSSSIDVKAEKHDEMEEWMRELYGSSYSGNGNGNGINMSVRDKWISDKTHGGGMDPNEREYPHQGIINKSAELDKQKQQAILNNILGRSR